MSEREESFFTVSVEIKNKKNILESLQLYVEGDILEGENKYFCHECSKKVDALKRSCINKLPDNLIIHAKRFEFDFEQMKRVKVNDYCEFPEKLSMESFTKYGLAKKKIQLQHKTWNFLLLTLNMNSLEFWFTRVLQKLVIITHLLE